MDWMKVLGAAVIALGLLQYLKGVLPKAPTWIWALSMPFACIGAGAVMFLTPPFVQVGMLAISVAQLGYENLLQPIKKLLGLGS